MNKGVYMVQSVIVQVLYRLYRPLLTVFYHA